MIRERERRPEHRPGRPEPAAPPPHALLALQRTAGNQAVSRMLQRAVKIGQPGLQTTTYSVQEQVAAFRQALAGPLGLLPGWAAAWIDPHIDPLVLSPVTYELDSAQDVVDWLILEQVLTGLQTFAADPGRPAIVANRGGKVKDLYAAIETLRTAFAAAGEADGRFSLFGIDYTLERGGANHYYVTRAGRAEPIVYSSFKRSDAKAVLQHLEYHGADAQFRGAREHVDNFVCSFLAEPTRWPLERVINVLAVTNEEAGNPQLTGTSVGGTLPMAAGSTWEPQLQAIGRQVPIRALRHARNEQLMGIITEALTTAGNAGALKAAVARRLGLIA